MIRPPASSDPRYPIGPFAAPTSIDARQRTSFIDDIERTPARVRGAVIGLDDDQLDTPYRDGGWTIRQVVHHLPDSHTNAYVRFKLALTEDDPVIRPYDEARWAELADAKSGPVELAIVFLEAVHRRWLAAIRAASERDFSRTFRHPEMGRMSVDVQLAFYAWHGRHHVAHVTSLRERRGWG